jgi:hypothetical protein
MDHLAILSQTIADHARKLAYEEWTTEYSEFWQQILTSAGLTTKPPAPPPSKSTATQFPLNRSPKPYAKSS